MDADSLRLVVAVVVLDAHQVGVGVVVEAGAHSQHVVVGLAHGLHQLRGPITSVVSFPLSSDVASTGLNAACLSLIAAALWGDGAEMTGWRKGAPSRLDISA